MTVHVLIMAADLQGRGEEIGWRSWTRIIAAIGLATRLQEGGQEVILYTAASRTKAYPNMPADMSVMMAKAIKQAAPELRIIALIGDAEFRSEGELRKFFANVPSDGTIVIVSGGYHIRRLEFQVERDYPDYARRVEYCTVGTDVLSPLGQIVEWCKWLVMHFPKRWQRVLWHWYESIIRVLVRVNLFKL